MRNAKPRPGASNDVKFESSQTHLPHAAITMSALSLRVLRLCAVFSYVSLSLPEDIHIAVLTENDSSTDIYSIGELAIAQSGQQQHSDSA